MTSQVVKLEAELAGIKADHAHANAVFWFLVNFQMAAMLMTS